MNPVFAAAGAVAVFALTACTVDNVPLDARPTVIAPVSLPASKPVTKSAAPKTAAVAPTTTTTTVRAPDGTTVMTQVAPVNRLGVGNMAGRWQLQDGDERPCDITLETEDRGGVRALQSLCLSQRLLSLNGWQMRGSQLVLLNAFGDQIATLTQAEPGRWTGGGLTIWR